MYDAADLVHAVDQAVAVQPHAGGRIRIVSAAEQKLEKLLQDKDPEKIQKACKNLGAEFTEKKGDLCAVFPVLPRYPVTLKIWFADEEFPASGKIFLQDHADHYLSVEDAVTVGEILLQKLSEAFSSL